MKSYLSQVKKCCPVIHIDDSDVVKPDGYKFESLILVRDGSESTSSKNVYKKGYHVTEATVLTGNGHPVSIFSKIHSSSEKDFTSINDVTFSAMERGHALFGKATFVMDRGYDCFSNRIPWDRTTSYVLQPNGSFSTIINGHLQQNCATAEKEK